MRLSKSYVGALLGVCLLLASCNSKFGAGPVPGSTAGSSPAGPVIVEAQLQGSLPTTPANTALVAAGLTVSSVTLNGSSSKCTDNQYGPTQNATVVVAATTVQLQNTVTQPVVLAAGTVPTGCYTGITVAFQNPTETLLNNSGIALMVNGTPATCGATAGTVCTLTPALDTFTITYSFPNNDIAVVPGGPQILDLTLNLAATINGAATVSVAGFDWNPGATGAANVLFPGTTTTTVTSNNVIGIVTAIGTNSFTIAQLDTESNTVTTASATPEAGTQLTISTVANSTFAGCTTTSYLFISTATQMCYSNFSGFSTGLDAGCTALVTGATPPNLLPCLAVGQVVDVNYVYPQNNPGQATALSNPSATAVGVKGPFGVTLVNASASGAADDITNAVQGTIISNGNITNFTMVVTGFALSSAGSTTFNKLAIGQKILVTPTAATWNMLNTGFTNVCSPVGGAAVFAATPNTGPGQSVVIDITSLTGTPPTAATADVVELVPSQFTANLLNLNNATDNGTAITAGTSTASPTLNLNTLPVYFTGATPAITAISAATTTGAAAVTPQTLFQVDPIPSSTGTLTVVAGAAGLVTPNIATGQPVRVTGELFENSCTTPTLETIQVGQP